jgi:peroxiredoxin (alkyl hydroperoxide reductase subunit C)
MRPVLRLNREAPPFALEGVDGGRVRQVSLADYRGRWLVLFFYPADFTFVCPTEIRGFGERLEAFRALGGDVVGVSVDDVASHQAWTQELGGVAYPLLADPERRATRAYGVLDETADRAFRATFVISPEQRVAYAVVSPMNVGRSVEETLRVLQALQTGRLCPADWRPEQPTLDPALRY